MAAKISSFLATFIISLIVGIVAFFSLLVTMNGFREDEAAIGINVFCLFAVLSTIIVAILSVILCHLFQNRWKKTDFLSFLFSVLIFLTLNGIVFIILFVSALGLASLRKDGTI
jgi:cytochrome bd-type quinol oxidase subunit 2